MEVLEERESGRVTIGASRIGVADGVDVSGSGVLITLRFRKAGSTASSGALAIEEGTLLGSEEPPVEKPGIDWVGGTLAVR